MLLNGKINKSITFSKASTCAGTTKEHNFSKEDFWSYIWRSIAAFDDFNNSFIASDKAENEFLSLEMVQESK